MRPMKSDYKKQLITVIVITLSSLLKLKLLPTVKYSYFITKNFIAKLILSNIYMYIQWKPLNVIMIMLSFS